MEIKLEQFSGPLDLLLSLIYEKEMHISDISIGNVTEQYLDYIEQIEEIFPEELADFLLIASKLLLLKSRNLLPQLMPEEEAGVDLADQLRLYKMYVDVSKKINSIWEESFAAYGRKEPLKIPENPEPPENVTIENLRFVMNRVIHRLKPPKPIPKTHIDGTVSLKQKITQLRDFLKRKKKVSYKETLGESYNKTEAIVGFLAILELVKQRTAVLSQDTLFSDITIEQI